MKAGPIALIVLMAALSFNAATILSKPWMRRFAFGCGTLQVVAILLIAAA